MEGGGRTAKMGKWTVVRRTVKVGETTGAMWGGRTVDGGCDGHITEINFLKMPWLPFKTSVHVWLATIESSLFLSPLEPRHPA